MILREEEMERRRDREICSNKVAKSDELGQRICDRANIAPTDSQRKAVQLSKLVKLTSPTIGI